jgi:hypothetical protein
LIPSSPQYRGLIEVNYFGPVSLLSLSSKSHSPIYSQQQQIPLLIPPSHPQLPSKRHGRIHHGRQWPSHTSYGVSRRLWCEVSFLCAALLHRPQFSTLVLSTSTNSSTSLLPVAPPLTFWSASSALSYLCGFFSALRPDAHSVSFVRTVYFYFYLFLLGHLAAEMG